MRRREFYADELKPDSPLTGDLQNEAGDTLFPANKILDKYDLIALNARPGTKYYLTESDKGTVRNDASSGTREEAADGETDPLGFLSGSTISVDSLRTGMELTQSLHGPDGVLLLSAGSFITDRFLILLRQRSIGVVEFRGGDRSTTTESSNKTPGTRTATGRQSENRQLSLSDLFVEARRGLERHIAASDLVADMTNSMKRGASISSDTMRSIVNGFVDQLLLDRDLLLNIIGIKRTDGEYLFDHAVNVALLSMAIGVRRGLEPHQVRDLGLGAIFQDVGMVEIEEIVRLAPRSYTTGEREYIQNHPVLTLSHLEKIRGLPAVAPFIGYQVHERADGSGYPRGRKLTTTHPYARIVGIADVFCAMTRPRPYRPAIMPHRAIREILHQGRKGKLDREVVRSLLDCVSAFPIGSVVELSDGRHVRVIRSNPDAHTQPVVADIGPNDEPAGDEIDLSIETDVTVVQELRFIQS